MSLIKQKNKLQKQKSRFLDEQFQIKFVRQKKPNGKYKTQALIVRNEKQYHGSNKGLLHKIVNLKYRVYGDTPSITKNIDSIKPKYKKGYVGKYTAKTTYTAVSKTAKTAVNTALAAETVGIKTEKTVRHEVWRYYKQKYQTNAVDDYHRGTFAQLRIGTDAVKGTRQHFKQKKQHR